MNALRPTIYIGDTFFGTWTYVDDDGNPVIITDDIEFSSSVSIKNIKHPVSLSVLDQNNFPGEIEFLVQTTGWEKGIAEMDIKAVSGIYIEHSEKYCFNVAEGVT